MNTIIIYANIQEEFDRVDKLIGKHGWVLNPIIYDGKPCRLENAIVYHLVKYTEEEEAELQRQALETELAPEAVSIKSVSFEEADVLLKQGYKMHQIYAKNVVLVKYNTEDKENSK